MEAPPADEAAEGEAQRGQEEPVEDAGLGEMFLRARARNAGSQDIFEPGTQKRWKKQIKT
jgi:hypothetical protein